MADSEDFTTIRVNTLRGDLQIPFDVFVKVGSKYIHYCRAGSSFEGARLDRLKSKQLKIMYIRPEDESAYNSYIDASIDAAYANIPTKPLETRVEIIQGFQQAAAEEFMENPGDELTYKHVRTSIHRFVAFLEKEPQATGALLKMKNVDQSVTHHSVNVATLATSMVMQMGMKEGQPVHRLALGCLLHDVDHCYSGRDISKPLSTMSEDEARAYKRHPLEGAKRFQGSVFVDQLVMNIIAQHEEHMDGSGFPKKLTETDMDPLVMIAATANAYDRLISFQGMAPKDALKHLLIEGMGKFPLSHLQALQAILKKQQVVA